ncbi:MAG: hypothetical protein H7061_08315 [Bdellovibrionaceae bacterium]|nr:hypothetical protein [Bdellovibrio sp.]
MKTFFYSFFILILSYNVFAKELTEVERGRRASLSIRIANYSEKTVRELPATFKADIEQFAKFKLTEANDLELVKNVVKILLIVDVPEKDGGDPSRMTLDWVQPSYVLHPALFNKAFKQLDNPKNHKQLVAFKKILEVAEIEN